jgi:hypothetical protein
VRLGIAIRELAVYLLGLTIEVILHQRCHGMESSSCWAMEHQSLIDFDPESQTEKHETFLK